MSNCPPILIVDVTLEKYEALLVKAQSQGLALTGESGSTSYQGMSFSWDYDAAAQTLTIHCTEKPMFIPCSMIDSRIRGLIA